MTRIKIYIYHESVAVKNNHLQCRMSFASGGKRPLVTTWLVDSLVAIMLVATFIRHHRPISFRVVSYFSTISFLTFVASWSALITMYSGIDNVCEQESEMHYSIKLEVSARVLHIICWGNSGDSSFDDLSTLMLHRYAKEPTHAFISSHPAASISRNISWMRHFVTTCCCPHVLNLRHFSRPCSCWRIAIGTGQSKVVSSTSSLFL